VRRLLAAALALVVCLPGVASALTESQVTQELRCVECGTPLDLSNAPVAQRMKAQVRDRIAEGWSKQEILDEFVADFGREVLATPPKEGFDLLAWLIPLGAVLIGLASIPFIARGWARRRRPATASEEAADLDPRERARLERELDAYGDH
jgi:cytochrome c-type biogenesis protein CcmH